MMFRYLIIDDEPLARRLISSHASRIDCLECSGQFRNAIEALNFLRSHQVDLIFLDIQMPEINGLQFIKALKNPPPIILTTAFRDFAPEAFDLDAIDYLLKPITFDRMTKAVNKFIERNKDAAKGNKPVPQFVNIKSDRQIFKIYLADILYVESLDDYVKVHLPDKAIVTRENISTLEERLPAEHFVRIHRSFIVNLHKIGSVSAEGIKIENKELPFGRVFKKAALGRIDTRLDGRSV
jgi:DNA-binding LytR/AlgR family response regulator